MYSRRKFAQDFKSGLRYGTGCSEVRDFLKVTLLVYLMKITCSTGLYSVFHTCRFEIGAGTN